MLIQKTPASLIFLGGTKVKILTADDERPALNILNRAIKEALPGAELRSFTYASLAVNEIRQNGYHPDVAFLDIEMPGLSGLELAAELKINHSGVNIIFVTGFSQYVMDALALRPSGYVMKPVTKEKVLAELQNLRNPPARTVPEKPVRIQCFGNFCVFVQGEPLKVGRSRALEMLAFLVDRRGAFCRTERIAEALWEDGLYDRSRQQQISLFRRELLRALEEAGASDILCVTRDSLAVRPENFDCDYYAALAGDMAAMNAFLGEYMAPYTWARYTESELAEKFRRS